jgi:putrescine transport system ATP-binding protein
MTASSSAIQPYVRIDGVTKKFGDFVAVNEVSLDIYQGEIFCLLGASGCGKTTLLRLLAGFETPDRGSIFLDGADMRDVAPYERPVNMMFQSYALFPHMTVEQNIAFGLQQDSLPKTQIASRVVEMLELVKLMQFARRKPHQLSGGQRQRVALARALAKRPKLLLLDEPLGALDKQLRERTQFELLNIQRQLGVTFVVVTHDQAEAMTLASRIGVMDHGKIVQVGAADEIYEFPKSKFVAEFIGSINLFAGNVIDTGADHVLVRADELVLRCALDPAVLSTERWCVAVRPEKIAMSRQLIAADNVVAGSVSDTAYLGDQSIYLVRLDSGKTVRVTRPNVSRSSDEDFRRGETIFLSWHAESALLLLE